MAERKEPLTTGEVADYCHVTHRAVLKWIVSGKLKAYRTPGKHGRIEIKDFLDFLARYNIPVPLDFQLDKSHKKILIVDDEKEMVQSFRRILAELGKFEIESAYDGFNAGRKFSEFKPDLIVLDIKMPGLDGYEVCSYIRQDLANKDVKILIVSGALDMGAPQKISKLGADDSLGKPFKVEIFKKKIMKLLGIDGPTGGHVSEDEVEARQ